MKYEKPTITTMEAREVLESLGPAQGLSSGFAGPGLDPTEVITPSGAGLGTNRTLTRN